MTMQFPQKPPDNPVDEFLSVKPTSRGVISVLYGLISNLQYTYLHIAAIRYKWEQDLNLTFTEELWDSILNQVHTTLVCI